MLTDQTANTSTGRIIQSNGTVLVSKLNPYAKEFYPSYKKSWRLRIEPDPKTLMPIVESLKTAPAAAEDDKTKDEDFLQMEGVISTLSYIMEDIKMDDLIERKEEELMPKIEKLKLETYTILPQCQEKEAQIIEVLKELVDVKNAAQIDIAKSEICCSDKKTNIKEKIIPPKTGIHENSAPSKKPNVGTTATKSSLVKSTFKSISVIKNTANILKQNIVKPAASSVSATSSSKQTTGAPPAKPKLISKPVTSKLSFGSTYKEISSKTPNKDCLSIKSGSSSEKCSLKLNSSSTNKIIAKPPSDKPTKSILCLQSAATSKTEKPKMKSVSWKSPRSTVAATLRKTETRKRRNLFPHDPVIGIEMSEILFK